MKHIKTYETNLVDLTEGDYIIIKDNERVQQLRDKWTIFPYLCAQVEQIISLSKVLYVETLDVKTNKIAIFWINETDIDRKATKDEIDKYELLKDSKKYNL